MAAQRMVVTSPWKLGLFVFLLVVGTGFGLVYAWMRLFGGALQLDNPEWMMNFYYVCGGVAGLGLIGYLSIVSNARPMDGILRSGQKRERLLKNFGKVKEPSDAEIAKYGSIPALAKVLERWRDDAENACGAEGSVHIDRSAIDHLAERVTQLGATEQLTVREDDEELAPLVAAINEFASLALESAGDGMAAPASGAAAPQAEAAAISDLPEAPAAPEPAAVEMPASVLSAPVEPAPAVEQVAEPEVEESVLSASVDLEFSGPSEAQPASEPVIPEPAAAAEMPEPEPAAQEADDVVDLGDLGGHELDANGEPIYDLMEFGAAEV